MPILIKDDDTFKKAHEEYKRFTADESLMFAMEAHEKWVHDYNSRLGDAIDDRMRETATKMKEENIDPKIISKVTRLSPEEIKNL